MNNPNQVNQTNYGAIYRNVGQVRRTLARPEDAIAIHRYKGENERAVALIKDFLIVMAIFTVLALLVSQVVYGGR